MLKSNGDYDYTHSYLQGYNIDWACMSAAHKRQSVKGADITHLESRLYQESVFDVAVEMRPDHNPNMVLDVDEGAGVSGQKKIYQRNEMLKAWKALLDGDVGTWFAGREDRLFRDRHGTQSSAFTEECQKHHCILIIVGKRCYDFARDDDLKVFKTRMDEAAAYLKHVRYMNDMQLRKQARGEWIGGGIIAPYAIDKVKQAQVKEYIKQQRLLGLRALDIDFTEEMSQAYRPVIYQPWLDRVLDLFNKFKLFNYEPPRLMRYIEEKPYLFPFPTGDDRVKYIFRNNMRRVDGGYTFADLKGLEGWLSNLQHLGWMIAGRDEESGEYIYLEDCFQGAIPRDLFEEAYIQLKGEDLDGNRVERVRNKARFTRAAPTGRTDALLLRCFKSEYDITSQAGSPTYWYYRCMTRRHQVGTPSEHTYKLTTLWTLPIIPFDREIVNRLASLAEHDKELATRIRAYFAQQKKAQAGDQNLIMQDIAGLERKYKHLQWLKTDESLGQTVQQIQEIVKEQQDVLRKIDAAKIELGKLDEKQPSKIIPRFYDVLGNIPAEFWKQEIDHRRRMLRLLIDNIQIGNLSQHVYALCVNWIAPVSTRGDTALLYRWSSLRANWTPEEEDQLRADYPHCDKEEILRRFPGRSWNVIVARAYEKGIKRAVPNRLDDHASLHADLTYNDWIKTCEYYGVDAASEKGQAVLTTLNTYAAQAKRREIDFLWLLPAEKITVRAMLEGAEGDLITSVLEATRTSLTIYEHINHLEKLTNELEELMRGSKREIA